MNDETLGERLRALSHPVRRALYAACLDDAHPVGELVDLVDLAPASVSEHLTVLRKSRLLLLERDGRFRRYRADPNAALAVARELEKLVALGVNPNGRDPHA